MYDRGTYNGISLVEVLAVTDVLQGYLQQRLSCRGACSDVCLAEVLTTDFSLIGVLKVTGVYRAGLLTTDVPVVGVLRVQMSVL